ncbi:hypothetical protein MIDIC_170010 [Alphaproteobacteria bacterium]
MQEKEQTLCITQEKVRERLHSINMEDLITHLSVQRVDI